MDLAPPFGPSSMAVVCILVFMNYMTFEKVAGLEWWEASQAMVMATHAGCRSDCALRCAQRYGTNRGPRRTEWNGV